MENLMHEHLPAGRLFEVADKETRFTEAEVKHLEKCNDCLGVYAQSILQVARTRAKERMRKPFA
jgi:hypothetical protein